ncbi:hypothetical protein [Luteimonas sp. e5]
MRQASLRQAWVVVLVAVVAALLAPQGLRFGLGVAAGGLAIILGSLLASRVALAEGVAPANIVLIRWVLGIVVRWGIFLAVAIGAVAAWKLPPAALLLGVVSALLAYVVSVAFKPVRNPD